MITLSINGKKVGCPSCYEELTTGTFQRIIKEWDPDEPDIGKRDFFKLFSILTGTDYAGMVRSDENEQAIWDAVNWYVTQPFQFSSELPKVLQIGEKKVVVPRKTGSLKIGQNFHLLDVIRNCKYMEEGISMAVAIALQPLYDESKYDIDRARELEKKILEMPIYLTHPIGFFLLQTVRTPGRKRTVGSRRTLSSLKRSFERMLPNSLRSGSSKSSMSYH